MFMLYQNRTLNHHPVVLVYPLGKHYIYMYALVAGKKITCAMTLEYAKTHKHHVLVYIYIYILMSLYSHSKTLCLCCTSLFYMPFVLAWAPGTDKLYFCSSAILLRPAMWHVIQRTEQFEGGGLPGLLLSITPRAPFKVYTWRAPWRMLLLRELSA